MYKLAAARQRLRPSARSERRAGNHEKQQYDTHRAVGAVNDIYKTLVKEINAPARQPAAESAAVSR